MNQWTRWKEWARVLQCEIFALYLACRDPKTPWYAKLVAGLVAAYALSPIDLIPDPIPIIGYLDDLILLPIGILLARSLIPAEVMEDCRKRASEQGDRPNANWIAAWIIILIWLLSLVGMIYGITIWYC